MAAYRIDDNGNWWEIWQRPHEPGRDATAEEAALMEKVVWDNDTSADRQRLRDLLKTNTVPL